MAAYQTPLSQEDGLRQGRALPLVIL